MAGQSGDRESDRGPLAMVCGGGALPFAVADAVMRRGRRVVLFALNGWADPARVAAYPHYWQAVGNFGSFRRLAHKEDCRDIVIIGSLVRPALSQIRFDYGTLKFIRQIVASFRGGDDHMLTALTRIVEQHGFRVLGPHEVAPEILVPEGPLGSRSPSMRDRSDVECGLALIGAIGAFDVGQAAVVADNHVLGVEAIEGTDDLLMRIADLRRRDRIRLPLGSGVLVKAPKPSQDRRFDLPAVGPQTIEGVARAGLAGLAIVAGQTIIAEPQSVAVIADREKVFVIGVRPDEINR